MHEAGCPAEEKGDQMKRIRLAVLFCFLLCTAALYGCSSAPAIEDRTWTLSIVQSETDGSIAACAPEKQMLYAGAKPLRLQCEASGGTYRITDPDSGEVWSGGYRVYSRTPADTIYTLDGNWDGEEKEYIASVGITTYYNQDAEYTLIVKGDAYSAYFTAPMEENG